jgi:dUTP pyrophosphatase
MIQIVKTNEKAILPTRAHPLDIGMDLTAIKKHKKLNNGVIIYDTGIAVKPPEGYYIEILPRSSISKTGWMLANSVGTIDPNYTGNLYIALAPVNPDVQEIKLPFCKCQLVVRKAEYFDVVEVPALEDTDRGSGGFGSTGKRIS